MTRTPLRLAAAALLAATLAAGCARHTTAALPPTPFTPGLQTEGVGVVGTSTTSFAVPTTSDGVGLTFLVPPSTTSATTYFTATASSAEPAVLPAPTTIDGSTVASGSITPLAYSIVRVGAPVTIAGMPAVTYSFAAGIADGTPVALAVYVPDQAGVGWETVASGTTSGGTVTVTPAAASWTVSPNVNYGLMLYQTGAAVGGGGLGCSSVAVSVRGHRRAASTASAGIVPNRIYVTYRSGASGPRSTAGIATATHRRGLHSADGVARDVVTFANAAAAQRATAALKADANVKAVTAVHYRRVASDGLANDPLVDNDDEWYLYRTNVDTGTAATSAWGLTTGSSAVKIAVIDTGVDETNTDLNPKIDYKESVLGGTVTTGNGSVQDSDGHGTNVAGLAAAQVNNGYGYGGVGYNVHLMAFKIFPAVTASCPEPSADVADEAQAIDDAVAQGASIISLSLGAPQSEGADTGEQTAVENAIAAGVVVVAAAGNEYPTSDGNQVDYPAAYPGVIAVGASAVTNTTANVYSSITADTVASYSNSGATLVAPGGDVGSNLNDTDLLHWIEGYDTTTAGVPDDACSDTGGVCSALFNGTSQATPQVSGTIALMESMHGGARSLSPAAAASILTSTAAAIPGIPAARQGAGLLNAYAAVNASR